MKIKKIYILIFISTLIIIVLSISIPLGIKNTNERIQQDIERRRTLYLQNYNKDGFNTPTIQLNKNQNIFEIQNIKSFNNFGEDNFVINKGTPITESYFAEMNNINIGTWSKNSFTFNKYEFFGIVKPIIISQLDTEYLYFAYSNNPLMSDKLFLFFSTSGTWNSSMDDGINNKTYILGSSSKFKNDTAYIYVSNF